MKWTPENLRRELARGAPVFLPVNPVEYHGPHLTLLNDHLISEGLARDVHQRLAARLGDVPLLVAQELGVGVDPCPGPGSVFTAYADVKRRVVEAVERLADLGAQRLVILSFHGSPLHGHALQAGVEVARRRGVAALAPLTLAIEQQMRGALEAVEDAWLPVGDPAAQAAVKAEVLTDFHAGFIETSLALHHAPGHVEGHRDVPPCPPVVAAHGPSALAGWARAVGLERLGLELDLVARGLGWYATRPFPGYTGRPSLANPESGRVFARALADAFAARALEVFDGAPPPEPLMPWLPALSLGGRLGGVRIAPRDMAPPLRAEEAC